MELNGVFFNTTDYELGSEKLGEGSFGTVYIAHNLKDNKQYAAKIIRIDEEFDGNEQMLLFRESMILSKLFHPSIVKFKGVNFRSFINSSILQPTIITEYLPHESLRNNLDKERRGIAPHEWNPTKKYISLIGIADAMRYLHSQGIIHRDLKPENVLCDNDYYPRVCDFGLSRCFSEYFSKSLKLTMTGQIGTPLYMAPELLRDEERYGPSVDVYAFSIMAYEIISGHQAYFERIGKETSFKLLIKIMNGERPTRTAGFTDKMWNLLEKCWSDRPEERPSFNEIFNELTSDRESYYQETVDNVEVSEFIDHLHEESVIKGNKEVTIGIKNEEKLKEEINELKQKIQKIEIEHQNHVKSSDSFYLGLISIVGFKKSRNYKKAVQELSRASDKGNCYASFILGLLYESGQKIERDVKKSFQYYEKSVQQGNPKGYLRIGICYFYGTVVNQDYKKAFEYFKKADDYGDLYALYWLGILYKNGQGVKQDYNKAYECFIKEIEFGNKSSLNNIGFFYLNGIVVKQDFNKSIKYFQEAVEQGDTFALCNLGHLYEQGIGVKKDYQKACEYYQKAADLGNSSAKGYLDNLKKIMK
ncbi:hypothetical protein M9Y10_016253 [Tritrichomonas musculus]|uniref:Protein kinase domain-containing protein n=1 Tax=Tritrichomonas musculus TaxID=1915356 RepID=A0ABR2HVU4_9EUKA